MDKLVRVYKPYGTVEDYDRVVPYAELVEIVGGYIQLINITSTIQIVCDEEGRIKGYPPCFYLEAYDRNMFFVGNVVVGRFSGAGMKPIPKNQIETFERHIVH